mmetsp:Transcript_66089/g.107234  ORF Transcript_66089/g.107234 Transcript_66089/m.107234 type:complete len:183 (+) Transcript_66089:97-645(+)
MLTFVSLQCQPRRWAEVDSSREERKNKGEHARAARSYQGNNTVPLSIASDTSAGLMTQDYTIVDLSDSSTNSCFLTSFDHGFRCEAQETSFIADGSLSPDSDFLDYTSVLSLKEAQKVISLQPNVSYNLMRSTTSPLDHNLASSPRMSRDLQWKLRPMLTERQRCRLGLSRGSRAEDDGLLM